MKSFPDVTASSAAGISAVGLTQRQFVQVLLHQVLPVMRSPCSAGMTRYDPSIVASLACPLINPTTVDTGLVRLLAGPTNSVSRGDHHPSSASFFHSFV